MTQKQRAVRGAKDFAAAMATRRKKQTLDDLVKDIESSVVADEELARKRLATIAKAINAKLRPHGFTVKIELSRKVD
jgi:hypothetical protein